MEKASMSTSYHSDLFSTDSIVFVLYNIFLWVASLHKLSFEVFCLLHVRKSQARLETTSSTFTTSKGSELELSREDLEMVMQKMGISEEMKREQIKEKIAIDDVSNIFEEKEPSLEEAREAFSVFDRDSDGFIDASELQRVLSELGFKAEVGLDECHGMIEVYDENKDGRIDFNEFLKFLELSFC
ncbi:putative calcium-binding protein CML45 [Carex littledalei]|uniref:Putative calcium-binding protein CML45 n=1 Tax=Carex littledalei TaxID=544730 RepID=A0A833VIM2_9POAL|nr:putative calcium-binding protein CML45 [Carex littledalei]